MPVSKEYLSYILDQLSFVDGINYRQMMGEYIIYMNGKIAAYLCDDRLLVKPVLSAIKLLPDAKYEPPYEGARDMILVDDVDDKGFLKTLFEAIYPELPPIKRKNNRGSNK